METKEVANQVNSLDLWMKWVASNYDIYKHKSNYFLINWKCCGVATPLWGKCEDETRTPKSGNLESFGTPATSDLNYRGQNTSPWGVFYIVGKVLKCRCRKWPRISHWDIYITSYGQKKGQESNWQFDSRPLKVGNRPDHGVCRWSATHRWKALEESYKVCFRPRPNQRFEPKVMNSKVPRV